jgi:hypothetical protein
MPTVHIIDLVEADSNDYGILLQSKTVHRFVGKGVHNPSFDHLLQVWQNRPSRARGADLNRVVDPHGRPTNEFYSYMFSAIPSVISLVPRGPQPEHGVTLELGAVVTLRIHGYVIGIFQVRAQVAHDPHLVLIDMESSASRQHYIDTGYYLSPGEEF